MKKQQSGFTLVEVAIVMVIIGLLLGGVLKGQEVITNARIKNVNNDFSGISAAIYSYQDRYSALPGDDIAADAHVNGGIISTSAVGTRGDGIIDGDYDAAGTAPAAAANEESALVWQHLRAGGLISGIATSSIAPNHAFGTAIGVQTGDNATDNGINGFNGLFIAFRAVPGDMAAILDSQNDDNDPDTGSVRNSAALANYVLDNTPYDILFEL